jgi:hypothetical protein
MRRVGGVHAVLPVVGQSMLHCDMPVTSPKVKKRTVYAVLQQHSGTSVLRSCDRESGITLICDKKAGFVSVTVDFVIGLFSGALRED